MGARVPAKTIALGPNLVANVSMLYLRSPSTSGKSLVMAITVAKTVTNEVMNLQAATAVRLGLKQGAAA